MIRFVDPLTIDELLRFCKKDAFGCKIASLASAYGTTAAFAEFWLQYGGHGAVTAAIGRLNGAVTLCIEPFLADLDELQAFLRSVGFSSVLCEADRRHSIGSVMQYRGSPSKRGQAVSSNPPSEKPRPLPASSCPPPAETEPLMSKRFFMANSPNSPKKRPCPPPVPPNPAARPYPLLSKLVPLPNLSDSPMIKPLSPPVTRNPSTAKPLSPPVTWNPSAAKLYPLLKACEGEGFSLPDFDAFYVDFSHRIRHHTARAAVIAKNDAPAACALTLFETRESAVIGAVAVDPAYRLQGLGGAVLRALLDKLLAEKKKAYLFRVHKTSGDFYDKLGFQELTYFTEGTDLCQIFLT